MATGLLIICTGRATKKLAQFQDLDKEYTGTLRLGAATPQADVEVLFVLHTFLTELGFDDRFRRMWRYYLAYCEAGFNPGRISVQQWAFERGT